jgi:hypothetical protein
MGFFSFDKFIFPRLVKIIYWIGLVGIVLGTIVIAIAVISQAGNQEGGGLVAGIGFIVAIVIGFLALVVWRVVVELWLVMFSIHDVLTQIRDNQATRA